MVSEDNRQEHEIEIHVIRDEEAVPVVKQSKRSYVASRP